MTAPFTRSTLARMRQIAREGGGTGNVMAELGWDLARIRRVADCYQIELPDGTNDGISPPPAAGGEDDDCITLKVAMPRPLYARLMGEAAILEMAPGEIACEILKCAFECGDVSPLVSRCAVAPAVASVASAFLEQEQQERT